MTRLALSWLGALVVIAWAVATAWAFIHAAMRRDDDVPTYREPEDGVQPWDPETIRRMTFGGGSATIVSDNLTTSDAADATLWFDWRAERAQLT
jgi:hypothetical protein